MIWRAHPRSQPTDEDYRLDIGNGQHLQILDCTAGDDRIAVAIVPLGLDGLGAPCRRVAETAPEINKAT